MNKEKVIFGIIGLLAGLIIGYIGTNYINRTYGVATPAKAVAQTAGSPAEGDTPAGHPPLDPAAANTGGSQGEVTAVIQKARNEASNFEAQMQAANLYRQISRNEQALEFLEQAQKIKPDDFDLLVKLGDVNFDISRFEQAEKWYQSALKLKPKDAVVRMDLGLTFYLRQPKNFERAITEFKTALNDSPGNERVIQNLIQALIDKGDKAAAENYLGQLQKINPNNQAIGQFRSILAQ
ncbi:MAG: tetratricopeptide repeat protein [Acidobacteria bacterium]|nr:tetratricopeptide repeat protein [Acidobacteriota bacterium]